MPFVFLHAHLALEVLLAEKRVAGTVTWRFERRAPEAERLVLDAVAFEIEKVEIKGKSGWAPASYEYDSEQLQIQVEPSLSAGELRIRYKARPSRGLYFLGPDEHYKDRPLQVWSQCQDEDARHWFPCHDKPHVKTTASFEIRVPEGMSVLCNGVLHKETRDAKRKTCTFHYEMTQRMASYLFTLVVGEFARVQDRPAVLASGKSVPIEYWVPKGREKDARRGFDRTPEMIELFSKLTETEYPYDRYTQVVVSEFIFGGMENTSATTMYEHVLLDERAALDIESYDLVAHELAHQWFGDWVTCKDWAHAWLNEGFATYFEHIEREHRMGVDEYVLGVERDIDTYLGETSGRYTRPIVCKDYEEPIDLFDRHLYEKGGLVLHLLRRELGDKLFFTGIANYLRKHAQGHVTTEDLRTSFEAISGRSLERFFDEWVYRAGHPSIKARVVWENHHVSIRFEQQQAQPHELTFSADVVDAHGKLHRLQATSGERHFALALELRERPKHVVVDPDLYIIGSVRVEAPIDFIKHQLEHGGSPRARRQAARMLTSKRDYAAAELLGKVLSKKRESWMVRAGAARALGELGSPLAFEQLTPHAAVEVPKVRAAVAEALGKFQSKGSCDALLEMLKTEKSYLVRSAIVRSLGKTRQTEMVAKVKAQLKQSSWGNIVTAAALESLSSLRDKSSVPLLVEHTRLGHPTRVRRSAASALAKLSDTREVRETLADLLDDPHPHMRNDVVDALTYFGAAARPALERRLSREKDPRVLRRVREVLRGIEQGDPQRDLKDKVEKLERSLGEVLGRLSTLEGTLNKRKT